MKTMYVPVAVADDGTFEVDGVKHQITVVSPPDDKPKWVRVVTDRLEGCGVIKGRIYPAKSFCDHGTIVINSPVSSYENIVLEKSGYTPATQLEWLTQEARDRGFKKGVRFRSAVSDDEFECKSDEFHIEYQENKAVRLYCRNSNGVIHNIVTGEWAEIIPEEVKFEKGKWYRHKRGDLFVICISDVDNEQFEGISNTGYHHRWMKECFHPTPVDVGITVKGGKP